MRSIVRQLVKTPRFVVTNLPVNVGKLNEYLQKEYPEEWQSDIHDRLRLLRDEEVFFFYRVRRGGLILSADSDWKIRVGELDKREKKDRPQFIEEMKEIFRELESAEPDQRGGVDYFIDEAHNFFDAREWQDVGRPLTYYTTQHRHLDDNVVFASQNPEQVEGRLRMLCAERAECRNFYQERFGMFKRKGRFRVSFYHRCPKNLDTAVPFQKLEFSLNVAEASCYATTGALGVGSGEAESQRPVGGLPWWGMPAALGGVALAVVGLIWFLPSLIGGVMGHVVGGVSDGMGKAVGNGAEVAAVAVSKTEPVNETEKPPGLPPVGYYRSLQMWGRSVRVTLEDGRILTERDLELEMVTHDFVQISGVRYFPLSSKQPVGNQQLAEYEKK